jgi:hypothetical protein
MPEKRIAFRGCSPLQPTPAAAKQDTPLLRSIFLLSPANASGVRARTLFNPRAQFDLAQRLKADGATLGEVYSFISGLYFRGKLAYAERFKNSSPGIPGIHIITPTAGLVPPHTFLTVTELQKLSATDVDAANPAYRKPLDRDALNLRTVLDSEVQVVLLGSIATPKYVLPLLEAFGERLVFPKEFVGRGDMSRGGLLLRSCAEGVPLEYVPVAGALRRGARPPKLLPRARR